MTAAAAATATRAGRHQLEADGERYLLVFDNATDPQQQQQQQLLRPFLPAAGQARVIIAGNYRSMAALGSAVAIDVFTNCARLKFRLQDLASSVCVTDSRLGADCHYRPTLVRTRRYRRTLESVTYRRRQS
jgi:hypothetical protein